MKKTIFAIAIFMLISIINSYTQYFSKLEKDKIFIGLGNVTPIQYLINNPKFYHEKDVVLVGHVKEYWD